MIQHLIMTGSAPAVLSQILLRQIINEVLLSFDIILFVILVRYITVQINQSAQMSQPHIQGAMALLTIFFGHAIVRGWSFATFVNIARGGGLFDLENAYPVALIGTIVTVVGLSWLIRIFTPNSWGERGWIFSVMLTALFVGLMRIVL